MVVSNKRRIATVLLASLMAASLVPVCNPRLASADDDLDQLQNAVEATAAAYDDASAKADALQKQIDENSARITEIQGELPSKEERCDQALRNIYVYQQDSSVFLTLILDSESFDDLLASADYLSRLMDMNYNAVQDAYDLKAELEDKQQQLEDDKALVDSEKENAQIAMQAAVDAREKAYEQATARAAEQAAQEAQKTASAATTQQASLDATASQADAQSQQADSSANTSGTTPAVNSNEVNWSQDKVAFVDEWTGRIDSYLSGTELSGYGRAFAAAAWDYGVDPRWSPAISYVESSCGASCFASYNAWGWMGHSFGSWEEAIDEHVAYLARSYGSTLTIEAAQKYCPDTYENWYNDVYNQMQSM